MADELQTVDFGGIQKMTPTSFIQKGNGNTQIGYVEQQNLTINYNGVGTLYMPVMVNYEYYNLFVIEQGALDGTLAISREDALNGFTDQAVRNIYAKPKLAAIEEIKRLPSLFVIKNLFGNKTNVEHMAGVGFVMDMKELGDVIQVRYHLNQFVQQQLLNEYIYELQLASAPERNELDEVHWAIKKVNLMQVLQEINKIES